jgi:spore coat protein CotH
MKIFLPILLFISIAGRSQTAGDIVYGSDQVITVNITFTQPNFWDSLTANYASEIDMIASTMEFIDNTGTHSFDSVNIRLKGNSSYGHPGNKKSFKIDFNDYVTTQKYDGMKKLNFNNAFKDPTFMREKVFMDLCRQAGIPAPRINYANVYMNGQFWGFYTIVEQVDKEFVQNVFPNDLGNLFKAGDGFGTNPIFADLKYYGADQSSYLGRYELKLNETANDWTDLIEFIDFINNSTTTDFGTFLSDHINKTPFLRSIATDVLFSNLDSYQNSARNYYIYHDMWNDRWEWIKWDANEAFGSYSGGPGLGDLTQLAPNYIAANRPLIQNTFTNSTLYSEYLLEVCWIMDQYFNNEYLDPIIDELKVLIAPHVYADNLKQYSSAQFDQNIESNITVSGGPGGGTVYGLKSFISARKTYLSGVIDCSLGLDEEFSEISISPNPFNTSFSVNTDAKIGDFEVMTSEGRSVDFDVRTTSNGYEIEVKGDPGIYFLIVDKSQAIKLMKF